MKAVKMGAAKVISTRSEKIDQVKEQVVIKYLPLVRFVAEKIHRRLPPGVDLEPLIHAGVVALLESVDRFNPKRGVRFGAYASYRIHGEIMQCLRSLDWVQRSVRSWGRRIEAARTKLAGRLLRNPTAEEMANELDIPLEQYFRHDQRVNEATLLNLDDLSVASKVDCQGAHQQFMQDTFLDPLTFVESKDLVNKLASAVEALPERERMVVTLYYHEELTLREIGEILDLSEGRICQIFAQAVCRLRSALGVTVKPKEGAPRKRLPVTRKQQSSIKSLAVSSQ